ncbi:hypothetical protein MPDQ_003892 [Monascus purpureus]|uniref:PH domain-containing protein n=1 Tax=Monascus purpureus TaxID=5098 RepID=A0A507QM29_MONPU|nr:hypothetical protein MPDQ_003892 [Monascus purpureus]
MSSQQNQENGSDSPETDPLGLYYEHHHGVEAESYTNQKLRHASAQHLHNTSRRFFIGPIPAGWLQNHRKSWYRGRLKFRNYTSHTVTFSADPVANYRKRTSDLGRLSVPGPEQIPSHEEIAANNGIVIQSDGVSDGAEPAQSSEPLRTISQLPTESGEASQLSAAGPSPDSPGNGSKDTLRTRKTTKSVYFTAREDLPDQADGQERNRKRHEQNRSSILPQPDNNNQGSITSESDTDSRRPLLLPRSRLKKKSNTFSTLDLAQRDPQAEESGEEQDSDRQHGVLAPLLDRIGRYGLDDNFFNKRQRLKARISARQDSVMSHHQRRQISRESEIIKAEVMLVRVEETAQGRLPDDYTENESPRMDARIVSKWQEYLVVCRRSFGDNPSLILQMYRTHVIPAIHRPGSTRPPHYEILLDRRDTRVNLYSPLDKTLAMWHACRHGTRIYILRARSAAHSVEWYTFLRQALGWRRPSSLRIYAPDFDVTLVLKNPFGRLKTGSRPADEHRQHASVPDHSSAPERFAATVILQSCMEMLEDCAEWADVLKTWSRTEKMGLAWKRYDRLEWIYGVNEENMFGALAMQTSHDLELRPRYHYPTAVKHGNTNNEEPPPIEGFLIRLTSQRGVHQRRKMMFFKRLYFFTQDHFLLFCKPPKALPPQPPRLQSLGNSGIPSSQEILNALPLAYDVNPFPIKDNEIEWLSSGNPEYVKRHDEEAYAELQRNIHNLTQADGYIDLCQVQEVRHVQRGSSPADSNIQEGPGVEFHDQQDRGDQDDGTTVRFQNDNTFEILLVNGLVVRLQAYNSVTKAEWMGRLTALVKYWKERIAADTMEAKSVKQHNLEVLRIDEEMESLMGQYARKWEVKKAEASPHLHNMCVLSGCRTIKQLEGALDLRDCYIYSGLVVDSDLLYGEHTFDSSRPGHHALPRIYHSSDISTSRDDDTAISFVVWRPLQKNYFRAEEASAQGQAQQTVRPVTTLGVHGRTVVFKARSRVEKDRWVMSIAAEIDRLQEDRQGEIRIVPP